MSSSSSPVFYNSINWIVDRRMQHFCSAFDPHLHGTGSCCLLHSGFHLNDLSKMNTDFVKLLPLLTVMRLWFCFFGILFIPMSTFENNWLTIAPVGGSLLWLQKTRGLLCELLSNNRLRAACHKKRQFRFGWAWYENINRINCLNAYTTYTYTRAHENTHTHCVCLKWVL